MITKRMIRQNSVFMVLEGAIFYAALAFIPGETVVAKFMDFVGGPAVLVGLASTMSNLAFYVGQFVGGLFIHRVKRQWPFMVKSAFASRALLTVFALLLLVPGLPGKLAAWLFVVFYAVIFTLDGFVGLCWTQIMARTLPVEKRGQVLSLQQSLCGGIGILIGFLLQRILLNHMEPMNRFRLIFFLAGGVFLLSACMMLFFMDIPHESHSEQPVKDPVRYVKEIAPLFTRNQGVRQAIIGRILFTLSMISLPVNYKFGQMCGLTEYQLTVLIYMPVIGQILSGFFWSQISKRTNYPVMMLLGQVFGILCALANFAALAAHLLGASVMVPLCAAMLLIKFTNVAGNAFNQHVIAIVDEKERANAIVLVSILTAPATLGTTLAGAIAEVSFWPVYAIMLLCGGAGLIQVWHYFISRRSPLPQAQRLRRN